MIVTFGEKNLMSAALKKVEEGEYFEALCLFAKVDSYESQLNQACCHAMMEDTGFATVVFRRMLARYGTTHNCVADLAQMGDGAMDVLHSYYNLRCGSRQADEKKISADPELLGNYDWNDTEDMMENFRIMSDFLSGAPKHRPIYDKNSEEYFVLVREKLIFAMMHNQLEDARRFEEEFMGFETYDPVNLEMQITTAASKEEWERGVVYAERIAQSDDVSCRAALMAAQVLNNVEGHNEALEKIIETVIEEYDDMAYFGVMEILGIACNKLGYGDATLHLADELFAHYHEVGCSALRMCVRIFWNAKQVEKARQAASLLLRAAPWDTVGQMLMDNINGGIIVQLSPPRLLENASVVFDVPEQICLVSMMKIVKALQENNVIDDECIKALECLLQACYGCISSRDTEAFLKYSAAITALLSDGTSDSADFIPFCKRSLTGVYPEFSISGAFISKLIEKGCTDKIFVALADSAYVLDLSKVTVRSDKKFRDAFAQCAALRKVDVKKLEKSYKLLKDSVSLEDASTRAIVYALLSISYKGFANSRECSYFSADDAKLYRAYVNLE